jgi:hypothetical protein
MVILLQLNDMNNRKKSRIHNEFLVAMYLRQLSLQLTMLFTHSYSLLLFETYCSKIDSHSRKFACHPDVYTFIHTWEQWTIERYIYIWTIHYHNSDNDNPSRNTSVLFFYSSWHLHLVNILFCLFKYEVTHRLMIEWLDK